ncbi:hypothetical protein LUZ60_005576 [Juncus effusus]|nr:hypothetical protein LUZ60_005576 [Juncus effusus]
MAGILRGLAAAGTPRLNCFRQRLIHTGHPPPSPPPLTANPLLARLQSEPESERCVKTALDDAVSAGQLDESFWEPLVVSLRSSSPTKALLVLEWKLEKLLNEYIQNPKPYSKLIYFSGSLHNIPFAIRVFNSMESKGVKPNSAIFNSLINACLSIDDIVTSSSLFEIMDRSENFKPDLVTYESFVSFLSKHGYSNGMINWYLASKKAGFSPSVKLYEYLILGFLRLGKFDQVNHFFEEMKSNWILPNLAILEAKLEALCKFKDLDGIKEFLNFVNDKKLRLNEAMVESLIKFYMDMELVDQLETLLDITKHDINRNVLAKLLCAIIKLHANCNKLDEMENAIKRLLDGEMIFSCAKDVDAIIGSYFRRKSFERLDLFLDRIRGYYRLEKSTYDILVAGFRRFELHERLGMLKMDMNLVGFA